MLWSAGVNSHVPAWRATLPLTGSLRLIVTGSLFGSVTQSDTLTGSAVSLRVISTEQVILGGSLTTLTLIIALAWLPAPSVATASNVSGPSTFAAW